jgi:hypothetical protein
MHRVGRLCALALIRRAGACAPPPPPPVPVAARFVTCPSDNVEPYECVLMWTSGGEGTRATVEAWTKEPPTFIYLHAALERKQPDGSFSLFWQDWNKAGGPTQRKEWVTAAIMCLAGYYQWHVDVQFASQPRTTYISTSSPFYVTGVSP